VTVCLGLCLIPATLKSRVGEFELLGVRREIRELTKFLLYLGVGSPVSVGILDDRLIPLPFLV
jgi:hypothetical protein